MSRRRWLACSLVSLLANCAGAPSTPLKEDICVRTVNADKVSLFMSEEGEALFATVKRRGEEFELEIGRVFPPCSRETLVVSGNEGHPTFFVGEARSDERSWNPLFIRSFSSEHSLELVDRVGVTAIGQCRVDELSSGADAHALRVLVLGECSACSVGATPLATVVAGGVRWDCLERGPFALHPRGHLLASQSVDSIRLSSLDNEVLASGPWRGVTARHFSANNEPILFGDGLLESDAGARRRFFETELDGGEIAWRLGSLDTQLVRTFWSRVRDGQFWILGKPRVNELPAGAFAAFRLLMVEADGGSSSRDIFTSNPLEPFLVFDDHGGPWVVTREQADAGIALVAASWR